MIREYRERAKHKIKSEILDMPYLKLVVSVLSKFLETLLLKVQLGKQTSTNCVSLRSKAGAFQFLKYIFLGEIMISSYQVTVRYSARRTTIHHLSKSSSLPARPNINSVAGLWMDIFFDLLLSEHWIKHAEEIDIVVLLSDERVCLKTLYRISTSLTAACMRTHRYANLHRQPRGRQHVVQA